MATERNTNKCRFGLLLAGSLLALCSSASYGQTSELYRISVANLLEARGIQKVNGAFSVEAPNLALWTSGLSGGVDPAYFSLSALSSSERAVNRSIRVDYNPLLTEPLTFQSCNTEGNCDLIWSNVSGSNISFGHEGVNWAVRSSGSPCNRHFSCWFSISAWSLEKRRQAFGLDSWKDFPKLATVVDHDLGITIYDVVGKAEWATVFLKAPGAPTAGLGGLIGVELAISGRLTLKYQGGYLLVDFVTDRIFLATAGGLYELGQGMTGALTDGANMDWRELRTPSGVGQVLAISDDYVVWQDRMVAWSSRQNARLGIPTPISVPNNLIAAAIVQTAMGQMVEAKSNDGYTVKHWRYSLADRGFVERSESYVDAEPAETVVQSTVVDANEIRVTVHRP